MGKDLVPTESTGLQTSEILDATYQSLIEGLTGLAASERQEVIKSLGHLLQRMRSVSFLDALRKEWEQLREKGKIDDDYVESDQHKNCLQELLNFLDEETLDDTKFEALKAIFLNAATERFEDRESLLPYQYMQIARQLTSGEVLVLRAVFEIQKSSYDTSSSSARSWLDRVAAESGLQFRPLVELHERGLIEKRLLSSRLHPDESGVNLGEHFRLTDLGFELCCFMASQSEVVDG